MSANWKSEEARHFNDLVRRHGDYHAFSSETTGRILSDFLFKGRVLELGCSTAAFGRKMPSDAMVFGLDISLESLKIAKIYEQVILGDAEHLPFRDGAFDVVFCGHILHHLVDVVEPVLAEIQRTLTPDGTVFVVEANDNIFHRAILFWDRLKKVHSCTSKEKLMTISELCRIFDGSNFKSRFWIESHSYRSKEGRTYQFRKLLSLLISRMFPYVIKGIAQKKP